jgi:DNA-binding NarL/FixJ family response regulator
MRAGVKALLNGEPDLEVTAEAGDGSAALAFARDIRPDVVVMDVSLPQLGGPDATKHILAEHPEQRVLAFSAHEEIAFARLMLDAGARGYAIKRSACDELVRAVRVVAGGRTYVDPSLASALMGHGQPVSSSTGAPIVGLSEREAEVIRLIAHGHTSKEMARALGLSPRTLETYKARAMSKLQLRTGADLIRYALRSAGCTTLRVHERKLPPTAALLGWGALVPARAERGACPLHPRRGQTHGNAQKSQ